MVLQISSHVYINVIFLATSLLQDDNKIEKGSNPWNDQYPRTTTVSYGMYAQIIIIILFLELYQILHAV